MTRSIAVAECSWLEPLDVWYYPSTLAPNGIMLTPVQVTTACLSAMIAEYAGTTNKVGNGFGVFFIFLSAHFAPLVVLH